MNLFSPRAAARWLPLYGLYLSTRLYALDLLPMFLDERIHLRWALSIAEGRRLRLPFISGRGLNVWLLAAIAPYVEDPILAGRLLTVAVGAVALFACHQVARALFGERAALLAAVFYILCPFTLFYDRMVLNDAFLSAFAALTLLFVVQLAREPRPAVGILMGMALALAIVSKTTGLVVAALPPAAVALLGTRERRRDAAKALAVGYATAAALAAYPLWLFFTRTSELVGAVGVREDEVGLAANALGNLWLAGEWLWRYWTPGLFALAVSALVFALRGRRPRETALLAVAVVLPVASFVMVAQIWYPRYLLVTTIPALVLAASAADALLERAARARARQAAVAALLVLALVPALRFDWRLWTDPARAPLPRLDRFQYVVGWPSGYGVAETLAYVRETLDRHTDGITIAVAGTSPTGGALRLLLRNDQRLDLGVVAAQDRHSLALFESIALGRPTFVLVSPIQGGQPPGEWQGRLVPVFTSFKPDGAVTDRLYRLCPKGDACTS